MIVFRGEILLLLYFILFILLLKKKNRKIIKISRKNHHRNSAQNILFPPDSPFSNAPVQSKKSLRKHIFNRDRTHCRKRDIVADKSALWIVTQKLFACLRIHIFGLSIRSKINFIRSSQVETSRCELLFIRDTRDKIVS